MKRCHGSLEIINKPDNADRFHSLHWSDDPYTLRAFAEPKDIEAGAMARLDIIFTTEDGEESVSQGGEYKAKLAIVNEAGNLFAKDLMIKSPTRGEELVIEI